MHIGYDTFANMANGQVDAFGVTGRKIQGKDTTVSVDLSDHHKSKFRLTFTYEEWDRLREQVDCQFELLK